MKKFDHRIVSALSVDEKVEALVRVRNPFQLNVLENSFEITHKYPFIRSVGIMCGLNEAIKLERMQEVESVTAQSLVTLFEDTDKQAINSTENNRDNGLRDVSGGSKEKNEPENIEKDDNLTLTDESRKNLEKDNAVILNRNNSIATLSKQGLTGEGVTLCVMDTGISPHTDLSLPRERILHFVDLMNGYEEPYDDNGHGTFVSGVAAGNGILSAKKVNGIAPGANLIGLKVIGSNGETGTFKILDGMQWLFDNALRYGIKVVCMSFGAEPMQYADPLKIGVEMLVASGLTIVCAAGNSGENNLKSPGISPDVISVGSVDDSGNVASFSSYGTYQGYRRPDVYAKGVKLKGLKAGGTYSFMSGTSVSAPYVAGACCLLHQKYKNLKPRQVKQMIIESCYDKDGIKIFSLD